MLLGFFLKKLFKWRLDRYGIGLDSNRQISTEAEASCIPRPERGGHQDESYLALALEPAVGGTGRARDPPQPWGEGLRPAVWVTRCSTWAALILSGWDNLRRDGMGWDSRA